MSIPRYNEAQIAEILGNHLSPSQEIKSPDRLIGRDGYILRIKRALQSPGRHIFIFGDRGVGKTSLAVTAGQICATEKKNFIYVPCSHDTTFYDLIWTVGLSVVGVDAVVGKNGGYTFGVNFAGAGGFNLGSSAGRESLDRPTSFAECLAIIKFVRSKLTGQIIVAIDEIDRIISVEEKAHFAELLKNVGSVVDEVRFIYCGIGADVDDIIGSHLSVGRMFEPIEVEKLSHDSLWRIIEDTATVLGVMIPHGLLLRIGVISDGFPHYVHLIGECLFYAMHDDPEEVTRCSQSHFDKSLKEALGKAEPSLRKIYQMATEKSKNKRDYEEALWALADRTATRRQIKEIHESSYMRICAEAGGGAVLQKEVFNQRMLMLKKDSHAKIIQGHGAGWFSFREGVVRGYVRMKAESEGIKLVPEVTS